MTSIEGQTGVIGAASGSDDELETLRDLFHSRLESERRALVGLGAALTRAEGDASGLFERLRACSHRMHGAAAVFLFTDIARAANALEQAADAALTAHADKADAGVCGALTRLVELLKITARRERRHPRTAPEPICMPAPDPFSILLVDDDALVIRMLGRMLSEFAPLRFATSGLAALKLALESPPDLVLMDVDMPQWSGFEVCTAFKANPALVQVPIILISSYDSPQLEAIGMQLGAADFITKPPHAALVVARVRTFRRLKTLSATLQGSVKMDALTGAATRQQLENTLTHEWLRAQRSLAPLTLLLADIDGFGAYNAQFGETRGNACLHRVADALRSVVRQPTDLLGRYAGGQFALLLPETGTPGAGMVARRAIGAVDALSLRHAAGMQREHLTLSVGGGCCHGGASTLVSPGERGAVRRAIAVGTPDDLIVAAEHALRSARLAGGHQDCYVDVANLNTDAVACLS
jgi:diguanylate cyclase (GGDEF)-like protein